MLRRFSEEYMEAMAISAGEKAEFLNRLGFHLEGKQQTYCDIYIYTLHNNLQYSIYIHIIHTLLYIYIYIYLCIFVLHEHVFIVQTAGGEGSRGRLHPFGARAQARDMSGSMNSGLIVMIIRYY